MSHQMASLPLEPLFAIAKIKSEMPAYSMEGDTFSDQLFADMIGVTSRAVARWRSQGNRVPWVTADEAATRLGLHPLLVWGDEWLAIDEGLISGRDRAAVRKVEQALRQIGEILRVQEVANERSAVSATL